MKDFKHIPVLFEEVIENLEISSGKRYIDGTLGGGGHTKGILDKGGNVLGIDQDADAIEFVEERLKKEIESLRLKVVKGNFSELERLAQQNGFEAVDGILLDLGFSSYQIESSGRGFSFLRDEPLDMRMGQDTDITAFEVVNKYPYEKLVELFYRYGEEHQAKTIAGELVLIRREKEIKTSKELADIIEKKLGRFGKAHPATKVFQALRITVNDELENLKQGLTAGIELLGKKGRFVVISFHSLEDRIVKTKFREYERKGLGKIITKRPIEASLAEIKRNPRSRSAKVRVFEVS